MEVQLYSLIKFYKLEVNTISIKQDIQEHINSSPDYLFYAINILFFLDKILRFIFIKSNLVNEDHYIHFIIFNRVPIIYNLYKLLASLLLLRTI